MLRISRADLTFHHSWMLMCSFFFFSNSSSPWKKDSWFETRKPVVISTTKKQLKWIMQWNSITLKRSLFLCAVVSWSSKPETNQLKQLKRIQRLSFYFIDGNFGGLEISRCKWNESHFVWVTQYNVALLTSIDSESFVPVDVNSKCLLLLLWWRLHIMTRRHILSLW